MQKSYKTEIDPTPQQKQIINNTIGTCRYVYNFFIAHNKEIYEKENRYVSEGEFRKWLNNEFIPNNEDYKWIKNVYSKAVTQSVKNADKAFKNFFKHKSGFPKFKKKNKSDVKMYFVKNNKKDCLCERHRIKISTLGWVKIKEKGYIPTNQVITSGAVSKRAGRYYVSVVASDDVHEVENLNDFGIGIDLGIKELAVLSDGTVKKNINKTVRMKKLGKQLKREQRCLSRKYEDLKERKKKGEATRQNIQKEVLKVQNRTKLESKCKQRGIELRVVDRWYPSSKRCNKCGNIK